MKYTIYFRLFGVRLVVCITWVCMMSRTTVTLFRKIVVILWLVLVIGMTTHNTSLSNQWVQLHAMPYNVPGLAIWRWWWWWAHWRLITNMRSSFHWDRRSLLHLSTLCFLYPLGQGWDGNVELPPNLLPFSLCVCIYIYTKREEESI